MNNDTNYLKDISEIVPLRECDGFSDCGPQPASKKKRRRRRKKKKRTRKISFREYRELRLWTQKFVLIQKVPYSEAQLWDLHYHEIKILIVAMPRYDHEASKKWTKASMIDFILTMQHQEINIGPMPTLKRL